MFAPMHPTGRVPRHGVQQPFMASPFDLITLGPRLMTRALADLARIADAAVRTGEAATRLGEAAHGIGRIAQRLPGATKPG